MAVIRAEWRLDDHGEVRMRPPVVCGIDGSADAFATAAVARAIAERAALPWEALHVTDLTREADQLARAHALQAGLDDDDVLRLELGDPEWRLIEASRRATLLVVATRGRIVRRLLFGSVTGTVTRFASVPVLVVPRKAIENGSARLGSGPVVCAVRDGRDLPAAATAACWARELGRALLLAHVVPPRRIPATSVGLPHPAILETDAARAAAAQRLLDDVASTIAPIAPRTCDTRVLKGAVSRTLARLAGAHDAAFVVVRRRSARLLHRSTSAVMVCPSPASVLALGAGATQEIPVTPQAPARRAQ
jgi:nucleotide-binding universal stress UspA family protein